MSQMEPYDYSQFPPTYGDDEFDEPIQMRGGSSWQPGWRPPSQQPGCGPWHGPGPGGGGWPFWGYWGFRLRSAWRDVKFLQKLIHDIVSDMIDAGIVAPGPNYVPPSGQTPTPPGIKGVTDGSDAGPGQVGEYLSSNTVISIQPTVGQTQSVSTLILSPGDWNVQAVLRPVDNTAPLYLWGTQFVLKPVPTGVSGDMFCMLASGDQSQNTDISVLLVSPTVKANVSAPTLLAFTVTSNILMPTSASPSGATGTLNFTVTARRMR